MKTNKIKLTTYVERLVKDAGALEGLSHETTATLAKNVNIIDAKINKLTDSVRDIPDYDLFRADLDKEYKWFTEKHPEAKRSRELPQQLMVEWNEKATKVNKKHPEVSKAILAIENDEFEIKILPVADFTNVPFSVIVNFPDIFVN